jgi:general secretion pathway protein G
VFPSNLEELLYCPTGYEDVWTGPYLKPKQLLDPWDNPFIYVPEGTVNPGSYDIISYGSDGQQGGTGEAADIYNE